jgi:hypothetical protein
MRNRATVMAGIMGFVLFSFGAAANAGVAASSGDTCTATGTTGSPNSSFVVNITIPVDAPKQYGFAFGLPGASVMNTVISGTQGTLSTRSLPAGTTGAWITTDPLVPSSVVANVQSTGSVSGGVVTVVPASGPLPNPTYLGAFTCKLNASSTGTASNAFTVSHTAPYVAKVKGWHLTVTIPGAGVVTADQAEPTTGGSSSKSITAKSLVQTHSQGLKSAGKVILTFKPTAAGQVVLKQKRKLAVKITVSFEPKGGRVASKVISLTLKK